MTWTVAAQLAVAVALIVLAVAIYRLLPPAKTRVTVTPAEPAPADDEEQLTAEEREFLAGLTACMKAYGEEIADLYDTPEGHQ